MAQDYAELVAFMKANKSKPLTLAKVMLSWNWASVAPSRYDEEVPTSGQDVAKDLRGSCGWRDILMEKLFSEIGIQHRRANFNDVPFQVGHSATELKINGKWMFFDATTGTYFSLKGSTTPISIEEARNNWSKVIVNRSSLEGWEAKFIDPKTISANSFYQSDDPFIFTPIAFGADDVIPAELFSIYFGPKTRYLEDGKSKPMSDTGRSWKEVRDTDNSKTWAKYIHFYDEKDRLEAQYGLFDDNTYRFVHHDRSDKYSWAKKTSYVTSTSRLEYEVIIKDDKTKIYHANNLGTGDWKDYYIHYAASGKVESDIVRNVDGSSTIKTYDLNGTFSWSQYEDYIDASGNTAKTTITHDDGSTRTFDWATADRIKGGSGSEVLLGTDGDEALIGFDGSDTLNGGAGVDRLEGGSGNDVYYVDTIRDVVVERENQGKDTVFSSDNHILSRHVENLTLEGNAIYGSGNELNNTIIGNDDRNILTGHAGNDRLRGMNGKDALSGGIGKDAIEGGLGADVLSGGADADTFLWRDIAEIGLSTGTADIVKDFSRSAEDVLNLRLIDADSTRSGNQNFDFIGTGAFTDAGQIRYSPVGKYTWLLLNTDGDSSPDAMLRLLGKNNPDASWFVL
jgi:Ca2+-binding RTX toxin-like protein